MPASAPAQGIGSGRAEMRRAHDAHRADPRLAGERHGLLHRAVGGVVAEPVVAVETATAAPRRVTASAGRGLIRPLRSTAQ